MLELKTQTYRKKIGLDPDIRRRFKHPIIFYLAHRDDPRAFFITFIILDFFKDELAYIISYFPENVEKVEKHPDQKLFRLMNFIYNPHCSIEITPSEDFLTFVENGYYFYYVNYKKEIIRAYTGKDLPCAERNNITEFGSTFYKDDEDNKFFYMTAISFNKEKEENLLNFYRSNLDFSSFEKVFATPNQMFNAPHVTRKYKNYLLNSEFLLRKYKNINTDKIFDNAVEYMKFVYEDLYKEFCQQNNRTFDREEFYLSNKINFGRVELNPEFSKFCREKGSNFFEIYKNDPRYSFSMLPGTVTVVNLEDKTKKSFNTTFCAPAHFEIDNNSGHVYTSSHNFVIFDKTYFLGPAAIDKFEIAEGKLIKKGTFSDMKGYRFTTHRVFYYKNKPYICSFGQPNRLYFIDAEKMELFYHDDIGDDVLSDQSDVCNFINSRPVEYPAVLKTIEVSGDGEVLLLIGYQYIYFYSFPERKIISRLDYRSFELDGWISLDQFYKRTTHTNYLD